MSQAKKRETMYSSFVSNKVHILANGCTRAVGRKGMNRVGSGFAVGPALDPHTSGDRQTSYQRYGVSWVGAAEAL